MWRDTPRAWETIAQGIKTGVTKYIMVNHRRCKCNKKPLKPKKRLAYRQWQSVYLAGARTWETEKGGEIENKRERERENENTRTQFPIS